LRDHCRTLDLFLLSSGFDLELNLAKFPTLLRLLEEVDDFTVAPFSEKWLAVPVEQGAILVGAYQPLRGYLTFAQAFLPTVVEFVDVAFAVADAEHFGAGELFRKLTASEVALEPAVALFFFDRLVLAFAAEVFVVAAVDTGAEHAEGQAVAGDHELGMGVKTTPILAERSAAAKRFLPGVIEFGGVLGDGDAVVPTGALDRSITVRGEDGIGLDVFAIKQTVGGDGLGPALASGLDVLLRRVEHALQKRAQPSRPALVAELEDSEFAVDEITQIGQERYAPTTR
jgi:hypothetical protein